MVRQLGVRRHEFPQSTLNHQSDLLLNSVMVLRLESGCNIVFTHGARRAKVARSLIDARGSNDARGSPLNEEKAILLTKITFFSLSIRTSSARNENLRQLLFRNIPLISGKYGLKKQF